MPLDQDQGHRGALLSLLLLRSLLLLLPLLKLSVLLLLPEDEGRNPDPGTVRDRTSPG